MHNIIETKKKNTSPLASSCLFISHCSDIKVVPGERIPSAQGYYCRLDIDFYLVMRQI